MLLMLIIECVYDEFDDLDDNDREDDYTFIFYIYIR
jgi:hypothetical protein